MKSSVLHNSLSVLNEVCAVAQFELRFSRIVFLLIKSAGVVKHKKYKMKRIYIMAWFTILTLSLINISCKKEPIHSQDTTLPPPLPPSPPAPSTQNIWAHANMDITIELPMNFAILHGGTTGPGRTGSKVKWEKISGPASYLLESPDSSQTKVTDLEKGSYAFKLSAISNTGQTSTDTMTLIVQDATSPKKQIFFQNLNWSCPFGCSISVEDALSYLPPNSPFTLYIRREFSSDWELIVPEFSSSTAGFVYTVWAGQISVFEISDIEATDHPEIKIVF